MGPAEKCKSISRSMSPPTSPESHTLLGARTMGAMPAYRAAMQSWPVVSRSKEECSMSIKMPSKPAVFAIIGISTDRTSLMLSV